MIRTYSIYLLALLAGIFIWGTGLQEAFAADDSPILDKQQQLDRFTWWDNRDWDWYKQNIPFFESPDTAIDSIYYYRWELVTKHMTYGSPESGYSFKEFITPMPWAGSYGAISCPASLQIYELRWLKNRRITDDFIRYWFHTPGAQPRSYSNWYSDAVWANYLVNGDKDFVIGTLPDMEAQYKGWLESHWDENHQMFHWSGMHDGMEDTIGSRQTQQPFDGADSYRPTLNSYIYGDLLATANTAELAGAPDKANQFRAKAAALKEKVQDQLWDSRRNFFFGQFHDDEKSEDGKYTIKTNTLIYQDGQFAGDSHGRELSGYAPWMFDLPDKGKGYEVAWKGAADPDVFLAKYGLSFTERHDPLFLITNGAPGCIWSGNNWPLADSEVLMAMANVLNNYPQTVISKKDYFKVFQAYTQTYLAEAQPYIAEDQNPDTGHWINNSVNASEHYFHSSYIDLLISGLVGLRPRTDDTVEVNPLVPDDWNYFALDDVAYHGHKLSIIWDRDGTRYHRGNGLTLLIDGTPIAHSATLGRLEGKLPSGTPPASPIDRPINFAVNNGGNYYPAITASFTAPGTDETKLVDGTYYYHDQHPVNRWTTVGSPNPADSVEIDFGIERPVENVKLYVLDDGDGKPVRAPASIDLDYWDGSDWKPVPGQKRTPEQPAGHRANSIAFPVLNTSCLRAVFTPQSGSAVGLTEFEAWGHVDLPLKEKYITEGDLAIGAKASASFTYHLDQVEEINDGKIAVHLSSRNRWTAYESPHSSDWVQLDFPKPMSVGRVNIYWYADGGGVRLPKNYKIQYWDNGTWADVSESKRFARTSGIGAIDEVTLAPIKTDKLRLTFDHNLPGKTGVIELMVFEK